MGRLIKALGRRGRGKDMVNVCWTFKGKKTERWLLKVEVGLSAKLTDILTS